jgi:hypothetical protein
MVADETCPGHEGDKDQIRRVDQRSGSQIWRGKLEKRGDDGFQNEGTGSRLYSSPVY